MMQRVMTLSFNALPSISPPLQKYDLLMCSAPAVDFDCSDLQDARYLLNAVAHAAAHSGCILPTHTLRMMFCLFLPVLTPSSAAASVKSINMSHNWLTSIVATELQQHLQRFSAFQHVNMSGNPLLGTAGVTAIVSSLAGA